MGSIAKYLYTRFCITFLMPPPSLSPLSPSPRHLISEISARLSARFSNLSWPQLLCLTALSYLREHGSRVFTLGSSHTKLSMPSYPQQALHVKLCPDPANAVSFFFFANFPIAFRGVTPPAADAERPPNAPPPPPLLLLSLLDSLASVLFPLPSRRCPLPEKEGTVGFSNFRRRAFLSAASWAATLNGFPLSPPAPPLLPRV